MHSTKSKTSRLNSDSLLTRRALLKAGLLLGSGCLCQRIPADAARAATCCLTPNLEPESFSLEAGVVKIDLSKAASLAAIPSAAYVVAPEQEIQVIVVRRGKREYLAVSRLCTHASQVISYVPKRGLLQCNGFNHSIFDLDGRVVKGPAESPLRSYRVELNGTILRITCKPEAQP